MAFTQEEQTWLGNDLKSWTQGIRHGFTRGFILHAFHTTGVFDALSKTSMSVADVATKTGVDAHLLKGVLDYFCLSDEIIENQNGKYALTAKGRTWVYSEPVLAMTYGAFGSYASILYNLSPSLKGDLRYGRDYVRDGEQLAKASFYAGKGAYPWVIDKLKELGCRSVADLGCGSADVLIEFCRLDPDLCGVGIDIDPNALREARHRIEAAGLNHRIRLVEADLTKPETYAHELKDVDAINAIMVFHEFRRDGDPAVIELFRQFRLALPGKYLIMGEFDAAKDETYQEMDLVSRIPLLFYQHIIHPLTWQGLPVSQEHWKSLFKEAGIDKLEVYDGFGFRLVEYLAHL